jgi:DNA repair exonuclease SbcCD nuclease subunit
MTNILIIGDPHFKVNNIKETQCMSNKIIEVAQEKRPNFIVVLGDILDTHEQINMLAYNNAIYFLRALQDIAPLYILIGNHDRVNNQVFLTDEHVFGALKYWNNTTIVATTLYKEIDGYPFVFVPYVSTGRFKEALNKVDHWDKAKAIFCHQEFKGAQMGAKKSVQGDLWADHLPLVVSGHIHDYALLQKNLIYPGSILQNKFGDSEDKAIILMNFNKDNFTYERIDLGLKKKKIIHLTVGDINKYQLDESIDAKIVITCKTTDIKMLSKHPKLEQWRSRGARVFYKNITKKVKPDSLTNKEFIITNDKFIDLLHHNIKDTNLVNTYNELFL